MIDIKDLSFSYQAPGTTQKGVINSLSFSVNEGESVIIRGMNGSGKTTLLKLLAGRLSGYSGLISIPLNYNISYIPARSNGFYDRLSGRENIDLFSHLLKVDSVSRLDIWKESKAFSEALATPFKKCSVGMKQLINIFVLTMGKPNLILADEILKPLDIKTRSIVQNILMNEFPYAIKIFVTHDENLSFTNAKVISESQWL